LDTDDRLVWRPVSAERIVGFEVADIAMGSGVFLVAACRFLADRLVERVGGRGRRRGR
jgi:hypothetical protein